ncbi:hypothetical protein J6590_066793 [Homalodisca vitripennis]|nr:hypothetical protein J6590_066793 [Homalodisca vitripennis]
MNTFSEANLDDKTRDPANLSQLEAGIYLNQNQCPTSKTAWPLIRYKVDRTVKNATDTNRIGSWDISESESMSDV